MGAKLTKTGPAGRHEFQHENNQTMLMYTLLKVVNVFVRTLNASGKVELIFSILRTCDEDFDKFFILLLPYCGKFHDELAKLSDLKVHLASQVSEGVTEKQHFLIIELTYVNMNKILPHYNHQMATADIKTDPAAKPEFQPENNQSMLMHTLLKIVHVFVRTMNKSGNVDLRSISKDHTENFEKFFVLLLPFCEKFYDELTELNDLKVQVASQVSEGVKEKQYFLNIELKYINEMMIPHIDENAIDVARTLPLEIISAQTKSNSEDGSKLENCAMTFPESSSGEVDTHEESSELDNIDGISNASLPDSTTDKPSESLENLDSLVVVGKEELEGNASDSLDKEPKCAVEQKDESFQYFENCFKDLEENKVSNVKKIEPKREEPDISHLEKELGEPLAEVMQHQEAIKTKLEAVASTQQFSAANEPKEEEGYDTDKENREDFNEKLENQKREHKEELDKLRKEREEKNIQQQDELNEIRNQQKQCFCAFIECIKMKKRFEEMENEWSDWIEMGYKKPVVRVINKFHHFLDETRNVKFDKVSEDSHDDLKSEVLSLDREVLALFDILENFFSGLENVVSSFEDAMFPRVLQNSVCVIAAKLINVLKTLEEMGYSTEWYQRLEDAMSKIKPLDVPTVKNLRETCKTASMENFELLTFPQRQSSSPEINEVDIDNTPNPSVEEVQEPMEVKKAEFDLKSIDDKYQRLKSGMESSTLGCSVDKNGRDTSSDSLNENTGASHSSDILDNEYHYTGSQIRETSN